MAKGAEPRDVGPELAEIALAGALAIGDEFIKFGVACEVLVLARPHALNEAILIASAMEKAGPAEVKAFLEQAYTEVISRAPNRQGETVFRGR